MEDSSFMQWAINTLDQHAFPAAAASPVYDIGSFCTAPQPLPTTAGDNPDLTAQVDNQYRARSSGDAVVNVAVGRASTPISWKSSAASAQSAARGGHKRAAGRISGSNLQGSAALESSTSPDPAKDHTIAERHRREKINERLMELSSLIPGLKKLEEGFNSTMEEMVRRLNLVLDRH